MNERIKAKNIVLELFDYFTEYNFNLVDINVEIKKNKTIINFSGDILDSNFDLEEFKKILNVPRQKEYDEYYLEGLMGTDNQGLLKMVGYLTDTCDINVEENKLFIQLERSF